VPLSNRLISASVIPLSLLVGKQYLNHESQKLCKITGSISAPDDMQMILQLLALSLVFDKVLDLFQLVSTTRFEPAGVMKDKAMSCWILELMFDVVFSALNNYSECNIIGGRRSMLYRPKVTVPTPHRSKSENKRAK
jgi:hypothetical protein